MPSWSRRDQGPRQSFVGQAAARAAFATTGAPLLRLYDSELAQLFRPVYFGERL